MVNTITPQNAMPDSITSSYRMDEETCINALIPYATFPHDRQVHIQQMAKQFIQVTREYKKNQGKIDSLLHQYDLSTDEGIALMCLAEALLRIPDKETLDKFISDKISTVNWKNHLSSDNSFFVNAATWSLLLTGKIYAPTLQTHENLANAFKRTTSKLGIAMIRPIILKMMKAMGSQFVMGETIEEAVTRATKIETLGYRFSYDMLGESARTKEDADTYYDAYLHAISEIGKRSTSEDPRLNPGISVKLSALYPRFEYTQVKRSIEVITPMLLNLARKAKEQHIGLTVDAEEADRLELTLEIFAKVFEDPSLSGWEGFGLAVQAYQKRASYVIDWLATLAKKEKRRIMVRLVKGAYWDAEIKLSQIQGFIDYPVFTRKASTDLSYIACAKKLLDNPDCFYPQFGTHNAYSVAAIFELAKRNRDYEFQCLHGMGRALYDQIVNPKGEFHQVCRIYAPVGTHKDLLGYLVRRLLENGANTSFINLLADDDIPLDELVRDPIGKIISLGNKRHPRIPLPQDIYGAWKNSTGIDFSDVNQYQKFQQEMRAAEAKPLSASSIINGKTTSSSKQKNVISPSNLSLTLGQVFEATEEDVEEALRIAEKAKDHWGSKDVTERVAALERAAILFQEKMPELISILSREGGRCLLDSMSEVRETIDYCRYYAYRAKIDLIPKPLPGPTGEYNELRLHPRGIITCISPWNFPLAIFTGQIVAGLAAGNVVLAKPAEQTPFIAYKAVQILHQAGIPKDALQLLIGPGSKVGAKIVSDPRTDGVMFTGSSETAKMIERSLANREGPIALLIAETGGQNALIVDSSALPEQVVLDVSQSSFNSAGQRCSALRVLFVQEDIAPKLLTMLKGYMEELVIGDPSNLSTDIGPVIDADAQQMLKNHYTNMQEKAKLIATVPMKEPTSGYFFAPCVFELADLSLLTKEVFGPILHVIRYKANELDKVMDAIINTGYGLTLGIHSRIDATVQYIADRMPVGNIYVNRNMIGAVVGVQPFGGERLSGTGPKAGGPYYLPRLCVERSRSINTTAVGGNARLVSLDEDD